MSPSVSNTQPRRAEAKAWLSLLLGILAFVLAPLTAAVTILGIYFVPAGAQLCVPLLVGVLAVMLGHIARARVRRSTGQLRGARIAFTGLFFGYLSILILPAAMLSGGLLMPKGFVKAPSAVAHESDAQSVIGELNQAEAKYINTYAGRGFAPDLATLGPGSANCGSASAEHACLIDKALGGADCTGSNWCIKGGYRYNLQPSSLPRQKPGYCITATPAEASGAKNYCSLEDGVVRYDLSRTPRTTPYTARECGSLPPL